MAGGMDEPLAGLAVLICAVKHRQMLGFEMRATFHGATATDDIVGLVDLLAGEAEIRQQIEVWRLCFGFGDAESFERFGTDRPGGEGKAQLEDPGEGGFDFVELRVGQPRQP